MENGRQVHPHRMDLAFLMSVRPQKPRDDEARLYRIGEMSDSVILIDGTERALCKSSSMTF